MLFKKTTLLSPESENFTPKLYISRITFEVINSPIDMIFKHENWAPNYVVLDTMNES